MSASAFKIVFDGPAVHDGAIDVRDLAPALMAVGDLVQSASSVLNQDQAKTTVRIEATKEGSFEVVLTTGQELLQTLFSRIIASEDPITEAKELTDLLFMWAGGAAIAAASVTGGLIQLIKWLGGRKPERIEDLPDGKVSIHIGEASFITDKRVVELAQAKTVRENAKKFVEVLEREGIEQVRLHAALDSDDHTLIEKHDLPSFSIPKAEEQVLSSESREVLLQIVSLSFKQDNKWRLTDGGEPFSALILDSEFLKQIANNDIRFSKDDFLRCTVNEKQLFSDSSLRKEREITKVHEHIPASRQMRLL